MRQAIEGGKGNAKGANFKRGQNGHSRSYNLDSPNALQLQAMMGTERQEATIDSPPLYRRSSWNEADA
nr:hypothetical protein CFP56_18309 [Quercus suber]